MAKQHKTIPFDPAAHLKRSLKNTAFKAAYDALEDEFSALDALLQARKQAGLTQAEVAERMGIAQSALARIESSLFSTTTPECLLGHRPWRFACW